jgi:hypothetical protein
MNPPSEGGGAMITWTLSESLSASAFWISSGCFVMSAPFALHLRGVDLADALQAVGLGVGELLARLGFAGRLDPARLRRAFGVLIRATFSASASSWRCSTCAA